MAAEPSLRRFAGLAAAAPALAALAVIAPALARGRGLLPTAALWRVPPWNAVLPVEPGSGLTADQLLYFAPWRQFFHQALRGGSLPLWNPLILAGVPFAGCIQAAPFYPVNLLLSWLPAVPFSLASAFIKLFAAGFFTALHIRRLGCSREAAALSGVVFSLGGFLIAWLGHPHANVACLLPALFWSLSRLSESPTFHRAAVLSVCAGFALLGGHPPTMVHVFSVCLAYAVFLVVGLKSSVRRLFLGYGALAVLLGFGLAAPALLPFLEYHALGSTAAASEGLARWSTRLPAWQLLHLVMPLASGSPALGAEALAGAFDLGPAANFLERAAWTGLIPLALACFAVRRRGEARFHLCLAVFSVAAALGVWPLPYIWKSLPVMDSINPTRMLLFWTCSVSMLAGLGWDSAVLNRRVLAVLCASCAFALTLYFIVIRSVWLELLPDEKSFALKASVLFLVECSCVVLALKQKRWAPSLAGAFCLIPALGVNPSAPASSFYPETPAHAALKSAAGEGRIFGLGWALEPDTGMPAGLRDARGRDFTVPRRYEELVAGRAGDFDFYSGAAALPTNPALLAIGAVAATTKTRAAVPRTWTPVHEGETAVFKSPVSVRRALFVAEARSASSAEVLAAVRAPGFDPAKLVWLDDGPVSAPAKAAKGSARLLADGTDEVRVEVEASAPGWLLLLDGWFPGWEAAVDGESTAVRRADYAFRAVAVPAGRSEVAFSYRPAAFRLGLLLAVLATLAILAAFRRRR